jgi:hypothetical protein
MLGKGSVDMRALQTRWFVLAGALVLVAQACSFETELNPQPLPPGEPGGDHGESTTPDRGADEPSASPGEGFGSADAGSTDDADGGDAGDGSTGDGG